MCRPANQEREYVHFHYHQTEHNMRMCASVCFLRARILASMYASTFSFLEITLVFFAVKRTPKWLLWNMQHTYRSVIMFNQVCTDSLSRNLIRQNANADSTNFIPANTNSHPTHTYVGKTACRRHLFFLHQSHQHSHKIHHWNLKVTTIFVMADQIQTRCIHGQTCRDPGCTS